MKKGWQQSYNVAREFISRQAAHKVPRYTQYIVGLFFFLLPLQTRWIIFQPSDHGVTFEPGTLSVYAVELLGWVVIVLGLLSRFCHSERSTSEVKNPVPSVNLGILRRHRLLRMTLPFIFVVFVFLSIPWSPDKWIALQAAVRLLEGILLYFVILSRTTPNPSSPRRGNELISSPYRGEVRRGGGIIFSFLLGAVLQGGLGIYQFLSQSSFASTLLGMALHDPRVPGTSVVEFADERWLRAYGGLPHPNVLGGYLVVALAVIVLMWRKNQTHKEWQRLFLKISIPIFITGIFFTFSRAAWLAGAVVLLAWIIHEIRCGEKFTIVRFLPHACIVTYLVLLVVVFRPLVFTRAMPNSTARLEVQSRAERVSQIKESWELIRRHPLRGAGIGNYTQELEKEIRPGDHLWNYQPVHNVPLLILAELGIVGLLLFLVIVVSLWRYSHNYLLLSTYYLLLIFDHYFWTLPFGMMLFWTTLGLCSRRSSASAGDAG